MKAIIRIDVHEYQIGQEVSCYFKDTMNVYGVCEAERTGRWMKLHNDIFEFECDKCGRGSDFITNFCPNCGARMESEG